MYNDLSQLPKPGQSEHNREHWGLHSYLYWQVSRSLKHRVGSGPAPHLPGGTSMGSVPTQLGRVLLEVLHI